MTSRFFLAAALSAVVSAQAAVSFQFNYTDVNTGFNDATYGVMRRAELESAATFLASHFLTNTPITLTYTVTSTYEPGTFLAQAGSGLISTSPGFYSTVVQNKILTGNDSNGAADDGDISFNFAYGWGYGSTIAASDYDFYSTAIHEVLHSFGFLSMLDGSGQGAQEYSSGTPDGWSIYDSFLTTSNGTYLVDHTGFGYNTSVGLTPLTSGVFFNGANAVAAYGGLVPIFAPNPYESGSSSSHLDDATFTNTNPAALNTLQLMNAKTETGLGVRTLSGIELGILRDLNYNVIPEPGTWALLTVAGLLFVFARLRSRRTAQAPL